MATPFPFTSGQTLTAAQMNAVTTLPVSTKTASYTCVVGDVGSRIVMNVATANTVTINNSIFAEGDTIFIANKGAGVSTITAGAGVTINTTGSLALAQHGGGTLVALSASVFAFFSGSAGVSYGVATGGSSSSITVSGQNYTLLQFTSDGNLVVSSAGLFDVLMFGGGGGGGTTNGGGGGAGGVIESTLYLDAATYAVDVGAGGSSRSGGTVTGTGLTSNISSSARSFGVGGGGGGALNDENAQSGVCGGGGAGWSNPPSNIAGAGLGGGINGFAGGAGQLINGAQAGGGGGAAAIGVAGASGGAGGAGYDVSAFIAGSALFKGGGGGGNPSGAGGSSVGGAGGGSSASANTGSGGGGGGGGGAGGSGIVYVRFKV